MQVTYKDITINFDDVKTVLKRIQTEYPPYRSQLFNKLIEIPEFKDYFLKIMNHMMIIEKIQIIVKFATQNVNQLIVLNVINQKLVNLTELKKLYKLNLKNMVILILIILRNKIKQFKKNIM